MKIAERYVQALLDSANNNEESTIFEQGLNNISYLFASNVQFKKLLLNPLIDKTAKLDLIKELFPEYTKNTIFMNFISLLIHSKRINIIEDISAEYSNINGFLNKELSIKIVVTTALSEEQIKDIIDKYKKIYQVNKIKYEIKLDKKILGGIKVIVGNKIYDDSLETQLKQIF